MQTETITIKDIARMSNASVSTVSRVLNDHPDVSEATRIRIRSIIERHKYIPNNSARNLVMTNSDTIALIARGESNDFFTPVIKGIELEVRKRGYSITLHQINSGSDEILSAASLAKEKRLCGLILLGGRFNYTQQEISMLNVPFVCSTFTNSFGSLGKQAYSSVAIDDFKAAYDAVSYLHENGHRRIAALIDAPDDNSISELRYGGYKKALEDYGISFDARLTAIAGSFDMKGAYAATRWLIKSGASFSAIFCISDAMAIAAIKALHDTGRKVPDDCSVIAIDGLELTRYMIPTLTTLEQPVDDIARHSADMLIDIIEEKHANRHMLLPTVFRKGASVMHVNPN